MRRIIHNVSLADQAYNLLKKDISSAVLAPEQELPEEKLAADLGISRTPLREALKRLATEGLIVLQKGRPATVATFTKEDSLEYMELRQVLEIHNIEKIMPLLDQLLFDELKENLEHQLEAVQQNHYHNFIDLDREFHLILVSRNGNSKFQEMIHQINTGVNRAFLLLSNTLHVSAYEAYEEHVTLVEALESKDVSLAKEKMLKHLQNVEKRFLSYFHKEEK
ncbi:GntR family transcriptional regulator [Bacillus sp. DTU_2020_1000418_1_SI_GHA_SEK_038]|uniref:GntR family transcriptional regulator n=1 Tax=Bacillus sp. DTU_2020_1000418_1_SI_GHA_SEK_038 TaxID=3077585 RepID=UPI0028E75D91|nr:GntR family transcriptional regulator [Bacillus sp. DTU_2020_1000418_1_SI_GHA_SEK_038]WNS75769.1 GntR family transcriptional regulator [Bacillus sp. DTU_2020_1000418_1_SI_GHA_SEK_038]